ncbi:MAG: GspH/FimT family pseudopilin [Planctomycetota bacterium]
MNSGRIQSIGYKGFTLLELVLVMVILSTVLAMAAPSLRGFFASRQTQDAAAQILALTRLARSRAVCEGTAYRLNLDDKRGEYWLTSQQSGAFEKLKTEFGRVFTLPKDTVLELEGVEQDGSETFIAFTPQGTTTAATIRLIDRRGQAVVIACPAATESFYIVIGEQDNGDRV